ncbi:CHY zinc finger protein [Evansella cellulosilytica]|uniref:CHY-type domain-containing protein n=1 Tax=Evansella cellulosilytica (strain ATCC 21833 / DSM 2522 / FERM P-1141 / JCM 9156 / N-4) TaxID=649639 RepID=E6U160_EVAC2|nr:CHY zinc finger protein [Evansella cellulosilytica]ADU31506.1 hypothetical protein Bcell_3264 [Evansella cellulosilytica DSM 2522]
MKIYGFPVDEQGRCKHYYGQNDIVSIKFKCCRKYYPCYKCHKEAAKHHTELWRKEEFHKKAILCGECKHEISIESYLRNGKCHHCTAFFNPHCSKHYHLYFDSTE